jgi:hypothetical protein
MSTVITDNLTGRTAAGNVTITSEGGAATMQLQQGLAKSWVNYNGATATSAADTTGVRNSLNLTSLVDVTTGHQTINFSNAMSAADYSVQAGEGRTASTNFAFGFTNILNIASSAFDAQNGTTGGTNVDFVAVQLSVQGDLA